MAPIPRRRLLQYSLPALAASGRARRPDDRHGSPDLGLRRSDADRQGARRVRAAPGAAGTSRWNGSDRSRTMRPRIQAVAGGSADFSFGGSTTPALAALIAGAPLVLLNSSTTNRGRQRSSPRMDPASTRSRTWPGNRWRSTAPAWANSCWWRRWRNTRSTGRKSASSISIRRTPRPLRVRQGGCLGDVEPGCRHRPPAIQRARHFRRATRPGFSDRLHILPGDAQLCPGQSRSCPGGDWRAQAGSRVVRRTPAGTAEIIAQRKAGYSDEIRDYFVTLHRRYTFYEPNDKAFVPGCNRRPTG